MVISQKGEQRKKIKQEKEVNPAHRAKQELTLRYEKAEDGAAVVEAG